MMINVFFRDLLLPHLRACVIHVTVHSCGSCFPDCVVFHSVATPHYLPSIVIERGSVSDLFARNVAANTAVKEVLPGRRLE